MIQKWKAETEKLKTGYGRQIACAVIGACSKLMITCCLALSQSTGKVLSALVSKDSIKMLATMRESGDPMAASSTCLYNTSWMENNYVDCSLRSVRWQMSCAGMVVLSSCASSWDRWEEMTCSASHNGA